MTASSTSVTRGERVIFSLAVGNSAPTTAGIEIEVRDQAGAPLYRTPVPESFLPAGRHDFQFFWTVPGNVAPGIYNVAVRVLAEGGTQPVFFQPGVLAFRVTG